MTAILNNLKTEFENSCIKINVVLSTLLQDILTTYIAFPFKVEELWPLSLSAYIRKEF